MSSVHTPSTGLARSERPTGRSVLAWSLFGVAAAALVASFVLSVALGTWQPQDAELAIPAAIGTLAMAFIGGHRRASRQRDRVDLPRAPASFWVSQLAADLVRLRHPQGRWIRRSAYWFAQWPFFLTLLLFVSVFYLFPTGHLALSHVAMALGAYLISSIVTVVGFALLPYAYRPRSRPDRRSPRTRSRSRLSIRSSAFCSRSARSPSS